MAVSRKTGIGLIIASTSPIVAIIALLLSQGFCVPPWDIQSKALATQVYENKESAQKEYTELKRRYDLLESKQDEALKYLHNLHINVTRVMERMHIKP